MVLTRSPRFTRALGFVAVLALGCGTATADDATWARRAASTTIAQEVWVDASRSPAFAAEDAYVFDDPQDGPELAAETIAAAVWLDQRRMASTFDEPAPGRERVAAAFENFVALDGGGLAYASVDVARSEALAGGLARTAEARRERFAMSETLR